MFFRILYTVLFFLIPLVFLFLFVFSLCRFLIARAKNKKQPGTYTPAQMKSRKVFLMVSSILLGLLLLVVVGFIALLFMAIAYM